MAITATEVLIERAEGGNKFLRIRYTWSDGSSMTLDSFVPATQDAQAWITARTPELEAQAAQDEINVVFGSA